MMEKEILNDLIDAYRACYNGKRATGKDDVDLTLFYRKKVDELKKTIENVYYHQQEKEQEKEADASKVLEDEDEDEEEGIVRPLSATLPDPRFKKTSHEVIGIAQLRAGLMFATR
ncbi:hypothetical protein EON65_25445 [archaeon]|nr:MAG: hypothetical protein EON65_25445 [archaeon]